MSSNVEKLLVQVANFEKLAKDSLDKDSKKLDSKSKKPVKKEDKKEDKKKKDSKKSNTKKSSEYYDSLLSKLAQHHNYDNYGGEGVAPSQMTAEQLAQKPGDLGKLFKQNLISPQQYRDAIALINQQEGGSVTTPQWGPSSPHGNKPAAPAPVATPARSSIPFRADVRAAQIQFNKWNKENGNYATPIAEDGQLGPKTKAAFTGYRPGADVEAVIKDLVNQGTTWTTRTPEPKKPWDPGF